MQVKDVEIDGSVVIEPELDVPLNWTEKDRSQPLLAEIEPWVEE